jgi:hypothetical protein
MTAPRRRVTTSNTELLVQQPGHCQHNRRKSRCKDCGTGYCKHGRQESQCKDCGTGHCQHGRVNGRCMDCK